MPRVHRIEGILRAVDRNQDFHSLFSSDLVAILRRIL